MDFEVISTQLHRKVVDFFSCNHELLGGWVEILANTSSISLERCYLVYGKKGDYIFFSPLLGKLSLHRDPDRPTYSVSQPQSQHNDAHNTDTQRSRLHPLFPNLIYGWETEKFNSESIIAYLTIIS